jgi:methyltransferase (TIGR00027 family)
VRFVQIDFNREKLDEAMRRSDYDETRRTCFIWEGVSNYLTDAAVDAMVRWFAQAAVASEVIFTYVDRLILTDPDRFVGGRRLLATVERMGERWTFGLEPEAMPAYLAERSLELVDDMGAAEYRARYMPERTAGMKGYEFYRVARARVTRRPRPAAT